MTSPLVLRCVLAVAALTVAATAGAQYKSIGPDGRVTYSDVPPPPTSRIVNDRPRRGADAAPAAALPFELQQATTKYPVTLYSGERCGPCDDARGYLRARGVPFTERTVTSDDDIALFRQQSPDGTAPVVTVGGRRTVGFSQPALASLLDSAGYPQTALLPRDYQNPAPTPLSPTTRAPSQAIGTAASPPRRTTPSAPSAPAAGNATTSPGSQPGFRF